MTPHQRAASAHTVAARPRPTLEDRLLKFIEGHNPHIWAAIALLAVVVVLSR